jgi:hypothetical protein
MQTAQATQAARRKQGERGKRGKRRKRRKRRGASNGITHMIVNYEFLSDEASNNIKLARKSNK